jgi:hypothetical protein
VNRPRRHLVPLATLSLTLAVLAAVGLASPSPARAADRSARVMSSVLHPIQVRVTALDPVRHGADLRLQVAASSKAGLGRAQVRMVSEGGTIRRGARAAALGTLAPGRWASSIFTVRVPANGNRFYVEFQVTGDGPRGPMTRGACFNVLPDGPLETARLVHTPDGRQVVEVAARRID